MRRYAINGRPRFVFTADERKRIANWIEILEDTLAGLVENDAIQPQFFNWIVDHVIPLAESMCMYGVHSNARMYNPTQYQVTTFLEPASELIRSGSTFIHTAGITDEKPGWREEATPAIMLEIERDQIKHKRIAQEQAQ